MLALFEAVFCYEGHPDLEKRSIDNSLGARSPSCAEHAHIRSVFPPFGPLAYLLLRYPSGATCVWAQLGLRAPRGTS